MRIGIIGAGVAGSLLVDGLRAVSGLEVLAYERVAPGAHAEAGTGLNLGPNALKALRLHNPSRHAALRAASLPWRRWFVDLTDGTRLFDLDLATVAEDAGVRLRWSELYRVLREPIAERTRYDHELVAIEADAAGRLVPVFAMSDGSRRNDGGFDLLVAADGRYSRLRALVDGAAEPDFMRVCTWRLLVSDAADSPYDDYGQWFNGNNRLLSFRVPGNAVYIAGAFALDGDGSISAAARTVAYQQALFRPADAAPCPAVDWMLRRIERHLPEIHWARMQVAPLRRSAAGGRVLLLGDAAHAMVPTLGQGATQAVEDGVIAAAILAQGAGAAEIAARRDPRIEFVRQFSVEATDTLLPGTDVVAGTRRKGEAWFLAKLRQLYTDVPDPAAVRAPASPSA
jgi:2-polyprenyl-6-methoxyphenol hydroxylase-like FAD-dependent oxidoreductase